MSNFAVNGAVRHRVKPLACDQYCPLRDSGLRLICRLPGAIRQLITCPEGTIGAAL